MTKNEKSLIALQIQNLIDFDELMDHEKRKTKLLELKDMILASGAPKKKPAPLAEVSDEDEATAMEA